MGNEYPSDWNRRRKKVYRRDNYTCQNCGRRGGPHGNYELNAHHIVPKSKGGSHALSNLKTLCRGCHDAIHHNKKQAPTQSTGTRITDKYDRLDQEDYPYAVNEEITLYNLIFDSYSGLEDSIKNLNSLYSLAHPQLDLSEDYEQTKSEIDTAVDSIHKSLGEIQHRVPEDAEYQGEVNEVIDAVSDYLEQLNSFIQVIDQFRSNEVSSREVSDGVKKLTSLFQEDTWPAADTVLASLKDEAEQYQWRAKWASNSDVDNPTFTASVCPSCRSKPLSEPFNYLRRCPECRSEWILDDDWWTCINGPTSVQGTRMPSPLWEYYSTHPKTDIQDLSMVADKMTDFAGLYVIGVILLYLSTIAIPTLYGHIHIGLILCLVLSIPTLIAMVGSNRVFIWYYLE